MDERARRFAENEVFFRDVNERINQRARGWQHDDRSHPYEFLCECSNTDCTMRVEMTLADYERVRESGARFAIRPHHLLPEIEDVIEQHEHFWIIQKRGDTGEYTALLDPRHNPDDPAASIVPAEETAAKKEITEAGDAAEEVG